MGRIISQFLGHVLPNVVRPLHTLWNQMIGFLFVVLAIWPIPSAVHYIRHFQEDPDNLVRIVLSLVFAAVMGYFGIASFLRARKISRHVR